MGYGYYVDVEISLSDIPNEEMIIYLEDQGYTVVKNMPEAPEPAPIAERIAEQLQSNKSRAHDLLADIVGLQHTASKTDILNALSNLI